MQQTGQTKSWNKYTRKIHEVDGDLIWYLVTFDNPDTCHTVPRETN